MDFTPLSIDPVPIVHMTFDQIANDFGFSKMLSKHVFAAENDYAVKIIAKSDKHLSNEIAVCNQLIALFKHTQIFQYTYGYILCMDLPSDVAPFDQDFGYIYLFSELIDQPFDKLPDEDKTNEDFYFEILIGLYYARKLLKFTHWDIHDGNLMFNTLEEPTTRVYPISNGFYVAIKNSTIMAKLIDYGKSAIEPTYTDAQWKETRFRKMWNKSDLYHISLIFSHRQHLSDKFREFLQEDVLPVYRSSMYATKLESDSAANFENIEKLLHLYFDGQKVECVQCYIKQAEYHDGKSVFCGEACQIRYYE
jgi:hypothetical protein